MGIREPPRLVIRRHFLPALSRCHLVRLPHPALGRTASLLNGGKDVRLRKRIAPVKSVLLSSRDLTRRARDESYMGGSLVATTKHVLVAHIID
jgi:hypothetical protein